MHPMTRRTTRTINGTYTDTPSVKKRQMNNTSISKDVIVIDAVNALWNILMNGKYHILTAR